ncbi:MAG: GNAT family N-acetyltransferase [Actinomycetota bacterium]|nr:GNAT family N-acetyltransferase [Actinomycetota bacterium]
MFDQTLHAYLRALMQPHAHVVGSFLVSIDEHDAGLFRNYAVPDDGAVPSALEVDRLVSFFREHGRTPRLEYLPGLSPAVEPALLAAGFVPERRLPVMTCPPSETASSPNPAGIELTLALTDDQLRLVAQAQNEAYGQAETTDPDVARLHGTLDRGGLVGLAVDSSTGHSVGGGLCAPPHAGVSELAAVGVRAAYRRRGIATALTALLTRSCPDYGINTPFLTPAGKEEERIYRSAGYQQVTEMLHISQ